MLTIVGGPMFSGKTTWLINYISHLTYGSFILMKPKIDTRYNKNACVTHSGVSLPAINLDVKKPNFPTFGREIKTILIDELNFFSSQKLMPIFITQQKLGRNIIGAGLLYDYKKNSFGATLPLSKKAHTFIQLYAQCDLCKKDANHSYRKVAEKSQFLLGAKETYGACCGKCWDELNASLATS